MSFDNVIGQDRVKKILKSALEEKRLAHALLFCGSEGVGKRALAFELAKAVNCETLHSDACDECRSCRKVASLNHPDVKFILPLTSDKDTEHERKALLSMTQDPYFMGEQGGNPSVSIDRVRQVERDINYGAFEGKKKVIVILEADKMKAEAASALLKTLEEPRTDALLILTTSKPDSMLPTVLSRCQKLNLELLRDGEVEKELIEKMGLDQKQARLVSSIADGSLTRANQWASGNLDEELNAALDFISTSILKDELKILNIIENSAVRGARENVQRTLKMMLIWLKDIFLYSQGLNDRVTNLGRLEDLENLSRVLQMNLLERLAAKIEASFEMMSRNVNLQLIMLSLYKEIRDLSVKAA